MSKAYYYCKNFSFKQVNNLFAYSIKDPSLLTKKQRITPPLPTRKIFEAHKRRQLQFEQRNTGSRKIKMTTVEVSAGAPAVTGLMAIAWRSRSGRMA